VPTGFHVHAVLPQLGCSAAVAAKPNKQSELFLAVRSSCACAVVVVVKGGCLPVNQLVQWVRSIG
jgi:hypothetical protein